MLQKFHLFILNTTIFLWLLPSTADCSLVQRDFYKDNMMSPQTVSMIRYGDVKTSLFKGQLNFSIPVYDLKDPDFNLDITLCYSSDGFKPCKSSGYVGYNWFLQAGGCITREVRNYPDEIFRYRDNSNMTLEGMLHFVQRYTIDKNDIFSLNPNVVSNCNGHNLGDICTISVDYQPDIYHFNFCGYQGSFMINNKGKAIIISGDYISIDLSKTIDTKRDVASTERPLPVESSKITVKTRDGYTYIFGGDISALEYSLSLKNSQQEEKQYPPIVNTWHLSKVIAPNKRTMTFYYEGHNEGPIPSNNLFVFNQYYDPFATSDNPENPSTNQHLKYNYTKECILDSISVSGEHPLSIYFYKSLAERMYKHSHYVARCYENYKLDSIHILSENRMIKSAVLSYIYKNRKLSGTPYFYWRFLSSVAVSGEGEYSLTYHHPLLYPDLYLQTNDDYLALMDIHGYWRNGSTEGLLQEVIYPTGGKQKFTFGSHTYQIERRFRRTNANQDVELYSLDYGGFTKTGGARIEQIETYATDELIESTSFSYDNGNPMTSTGIYYNNMAVYPQNEGGPVLEVKAPYNYSLLDTHIGYSKVREIVKDGNKNILSKNIYSFNTGVEHYTTFNNPSINIGEYTSSPYHISSGVLSYNENLYNKGMMQQVDYYKDNELVKSVQYTYNGGPLSLEELIPQNQQKELGCVDTIVVFSNFGSIPVSRKLFIYPDVLTQKVTNTYNGEGLPLITNHTYMHDNKLRITRETVTDSRGIPHFTKYTYPDNLNVANDIFNPSALRMLINANRINTPVESVSGYVQDNKEYVTSGTINLYATGNYVELYSNAAHTPAINPELPDWADSLHMFDTLNRQEPIATLRYYPYLHKTLSLSLTAPVADYQPIGTNGTTITSDERYILDCEYSFDPLCRPTSVKPSGTTATTYSWDGVYLRSKTTGNQTYTYTYIPYVGVTSVTDPRGITTYYTYDTDGRLVEVYRIENGNKQILNAYQYHIKTE